MSVRVSPVSRIAAILIIAVGAFVLLGGFVTGELASYIAGSAFVVLGVVLYLILIWFTKKLRREIGEIEKGQTRGAWTGWNLNFRFLSHILAARNPPTVPLMAPTIKTGT